jgi:thioredoxin 2
MERTKHMNQKTLYTYTSCLSCHAINKVATDKIAATKAVCGKCQNPLPFHKLVSELDEIGLFKIIEKAELPIIVDFWAPWCGPCRGFAPIFETVSQISEGKIVFIKINTENYPNVSQRFNIRGIPTLIVFQNGKEIARESGAFPLETFKKWITQFYIY